MMYLKRLFQSRSWYDLVPDSSHVVVTSGYGSSSSWVGCARTSDGATVIAFLPSGSATITVNMSKVSGSDVNAWWFNPRDGSADLEGTYPASGNHSFTRPNSSDWVLVLDDASLKLRAPGTPKITLQVPLQSSSTISEGGFQFNLVADTPGTYAIDYTTNLSTPWIQATTVQYESGITNVSVDTGGDPHRFFRARPMP